MKKSFIKLCAIIFTFLLAQVASAQEPEDDGYIEEDEVSEEPQETVDPQEGVDSLDDDDGAVIMGEFAYLSLPADDDMFIYHGVLGYTFSFGLQLGGGFTGFHLNRPCLLHAAESLGTCPATEELDDTSDFAGPSPFVGWDIELVPGWFGFELTAIGTFPVTGGSKGWTVEGGVGPYFSLEALTEDYFDLAITAPGLKYIHADIEVDQYKLKTDEVMPSFALKGQF